MNYAHRTLDMGVPPRQSDVSQLAEAFKKHRVIVAHLRELRSDMTPGDGQHVTLVRAQNSMVDIVDKLARLPAKTHKDTRTKASILNEYLQVETGSPETKLIASLIDDLLGTSQIAAPVGEAMVDKLRLSHPAMYT